MALWPLLDKVGCAVALRPLLDKVGHAVALRPLLDKVGYAQCCEVNGFNPAMLPGSLYLTFDGVSVVLVAGSMVSFSGGEEGLCSCNSEDKSCWKRREERRKGRERRFLLPWYS